MVQLARITIYPIKSLDGVSLSTVRVLESGALVGDRRFGMRDTRGQWVNGKQNPRVHGLRATYDEALQRVTLLAESTGDRGAFDLTNDLAALEDFLSDYFQQRVLMVEDARAGWPDDAESPGPTLVSRQSLESVAGWFEGFSLDEVRARFRANLEVEAEAPFWEDRLVADESHVVRFSIGEVDFEGVTPCQRCVVPSRDPRSAEVTPRFARRFAELREAELPPWTDRARFDHYYRLAVNTRLARGGGTICVGDEVRIASVTRL